MRTILWFIGLACLALVSVAACGSSNDAEGDGQGAERTAQAPATPDDTFTGAKVDVPRGSVSGLAQAARAARSAEGAVGQGRAYDIEDDRLRGRKVWEVKVARGVARPYELDVRADGRKVLRQRRKSKVSDDVRKAATAKVPLAKALRIAGARAKGGAFDEAEIDSWRGKVVWEATFEGSGSREVEVRVDARSGKVLTVVTDD